MTGTSLTFQVNNQTVTLAAGPSYTGAQVAAEINAQVSGVNASYSTGKLVITSTGTPGASDGVTIDNFSNGDASQLGFAAVASVTANGTDATGGLGGETLVIAATGGGTATNITFGTAAGQISTLNQLNTALATNNLQATISTTGVINIVTSDDAASSTIATIGAITGTATGTGSAFANAVGEPAVLDPNSQATRANLVSQYNNVLQQINTTSQDSSFNGINLLNGDTLNLTFDETGASKLAITGVTFNDAGLGLSTLTTGTDFLDSNSADAVLSQLTSADTTLRGEASALGSNLSIVEIPPGLQQEPDQRVADRRVQPDAGRLQRRGRQQPGAVDPAVDRGLRACARQPVAAERAPAAPLIAKEGTRPKRRGKPRRFSFYFRHVFAGLCVAQKRRLIARFLSAANHILKASAL